MIGKHSQNFTVLMLLVVFTMACDPKLDEPTLTSLPESSDWPKEAFKTDYTIAFPETYEGEGMIEFFEGSIFEKMKENGAARFAYSYGNGLIYEEYGEPLLNKSASALNSYTQETVRLTNQADFYQGTTIDVYFFYDHLEEHPLFPFDAMGVVYMKRGETFYEGVTVYFDLLELDEVLEIVDTITLEEN